MMSVIVPLRVDILFEVRGIVVVLEHKVNMASGLDCGTDSGSHLVNPVLLLDGMHSIEAQTIEAVFHQPVEDVLDKECTDCRLAEINRRSPWSVAIVAKELWRVTREIVAVGSKVI